MNEAEWLECDEPERMIQFLGLWLNLRRARYFTREVLVPHLPSAFDGEAELAESVLESLDRWADGLETASTNRRRMVPACVRGLKPRHAPEFPLIIAQRLGFSCPPRGNWKPIDPRHPDRQLARKVIRIGPPERMSGLLREVFGNPFRPITFSPKWRTETAVALARQMYDSRDFFAMPILADALQDAGCDNDDILDHCRKPGIHVRGCWVVDLVLAKA